MNKRNDVQTHVGHGLIKTVVYLFSVFFLLSANVVLSDTEKRIADWELIPEIDYTYWCVPTSQTMIVGYYDNYVQGIGGFTGYGRLIEYWFDHPPFDFKGVPKNAGNTPSYIDVIIDPDTGTWRKKPDGTSWPDAESFHRDNFGCNLSFVNMDCNEDNDYCWNEIVSEVNANRPFFFSGSGHTTAGFGYQITAASGKKVIVYNPPNPDTPTFIDYIDHDWCVGIGKVVPFEQENRDDNLVIFSPDGGEVLTQLVTYKIIWRIWGNTIKTVDIDYSADGGNTWHAVATRIGVGTNSRFFTPETTTDEGRIRIRGYSLYCSFIAGDGSQNNFRVLASTGDEPDWCDCSWQYVGGFASHQDLHDWCPAGSFITQLDLDQFAQGAASDSPIVGKVRCCRICGIEDAGWDSCTWQEIGYDKSHFQIGGWCPEGTFLTQLDLDGDTSHGDWNGPVIGRAKCCKPSSVQSQSWQISYWQEVGGQMSHNNLGDWCPRGTFLTQLDLDSHPEANKYDSPLVGRCRCSKPNIVQIKKPLTHIILLLLQ